VKIPHKYEIYSFVDVFVVGYGERSLVGLPYPLDLNNVTIDELKVIPGIGKKAGSVFLSGNIRNALSNSPVYDYIKEKIL